MKTNFRHLAAALALVLLLPACSNDNSGHRLVILHTNDTHSQIDPGSDDLGGVMRRKAVIDSVRAANENVLLVDAGDAVQGTLYFYLYGGKVEQEVMNILGVDARILGNHEFDNGADSLAAILKLSNAAKISSNYKLDNSPLKGQLEPYIIKEYDGKRIGIIGINLDPEGIVAKGNYEGVEFLPIVATANLTAEKLKKEDKVDAVIALSHIGYKPSGLIGDSVLARNSRNIDVIIGGHSHDVIDPATPQGAARSHLTNLDGKPVLVVQAGKAGRKLGKVELNLDSLGMDVYPKYELIDIDSRYDNYKDETLVKSLKQYSAGVDSLMHLTVATAEHPLPNSEPELINFFSDFVMLRGAEFAPVDLAVTNKGGLRVSLPQGNISKGEIINMAPFRNFISVVELKGKDLRDVFEVMAGRRGDGISGNVKVIYEKEDDGEWDIEHILVDGKELEDNKTYRVATIDYLANGGDYLTGFTRGKIVASSNKVLFDDLLYYLTEGKGKDKPISASTQSRWIEEKEK